MSRVEKRPFSVPLCAYCRWANVFIIIAACLTVDFNKN